MAFIQLVYTAAARKALKQIDTHIALRIVDKIHENTQLPDPSVRAKALTGNLAGLYRYRVGNYRVVFAVTQDNIIAIYTVLTIKHRKNVYRQG